MNTAAMMDRVKKLDLFGEIDWLAYNKIYLLGIYKTIAHTIMADLQ